jgi:hypothetical protein
VGAQSLLLGPRRRTLLALEGVSNRSTVNKREPGGRQLRLCPQRARGSGHLAFRGWLIEGVMLPSLTAWAASCQPIGAPVRSGGN